MSDSAAPVPDDNAKAGPPLWFTPAGALVYQGLVIGGLSFEDGGVDEEVLQQPTLTLQLGWTKAAGVRLRVFGEPGVDRQRGGVVLDRG